MKRDGPNALPSAPDVTTMKWDSIEQNDSVQYNSETDSYRVSFDNEPDESISQAVISTVAVVSETNPVELPPLYSVIDSENLKKVITPTTPGPPQTDIHVSFPYYGHKITVHRYGIITVQPSD